MVVRKDGCSIAAGESRCHNTICETALLRQSLPGLKAGGVDRSILLFICKQVMKGSVILQNGQGHGRA